MSSYLTTIQSAQWTIRQVNISLRIRNYRGDNRIIAISIPPHTSLRLQRHFFTFYEALKAAFNGQCDLYLKRSAHYKITQYELVQLFNKDYLKIPTIGKRISSFGVAGVLSCKSRNVHANRV